MLEVTKPQEPDWTRAQQTQLNLRMQDMDGLLIASRAHPAEGFLVAKHVRFAEAQSHVLADAVVQRVILEYRYSRAGAYIHAPSHKH